MKTKRHLLLVANCGAKSGMVAAAAMNGLRSWVRHRACCAELHNRTNIDTIRTEGVLDNSFNKRTMVCESGYNCKHKDLSLVN